jgi:hypothetical protein
MVTKTKKQSGEKRKKRKVKVLNLNKETIKDLTAGEVKRVEGGIGSNNACLSDVSCAGQSAIRQRTFACAADITAPAKCTITI